MTQETDPSKLLVVWSSGDRDVALNMVFMYTYNAKRKGWWENIRLLIWGTSSKLLACKACADRYGVSETLQSLGVDVKYMGVGLTEMLKGGWITLTF